MKVSDLKCRALYDDLKNIAGDKIFDGIRKSSFLITGGNGFIASYIVLALLTLNDESGNNNKVTVLVRNKERAVEKYGELVNRNDFEIIVQDVCSELIGNIQYDYIVHAASAASAQQFEDDPIGVFNSNVIGTENLISYIRQIPCKCMLYVSSFTVYGNNTSSTAELTEDFRGPDDWNSNRASYAFGKRCGEFVCGAAYRKYNLPIRIVRPGFVYGSSSPNDNRVYSEIIRCVAENKNVILQSQGYVFRSMVYVSDVARGIFHTLFNGINGEAYNIANEFVSIRDFAELAVASGSSDKIKLCFKNTEDENAKCESIPGGAMSTQKLKQIGWKPEISIRQGIRLASEIYIADFMN